MNEVHASRFDNVHGSDAYGNPVDELPEDVLDSIKRNGVTIQPSFLMPHCMDCFGCVCLLCRDSTGLWVSAWFLLIPAAPPALQRQR